MAKLLRPGMRLLPGDARGMPESQAERWERLRPLLRLTRPGEREPARAGQYERGVRLPRPRSGVEGPEASLSLERPAESQPSAPEPVLEERPMSAIGLWQQRHMQALEEPEPEVPELVEGRGRGAYRYRGRVHAPSKAERILSTGLLAFAAPSMGPQAARQMAEEIWYGPYSRAMGQANEARRRRGEKVERTGKLAQLEREDQERRQPKYQEVAGGLARIPSLEEGGDPRMVIPARTTPHEDRYQEVGGRVVRLPSSREREPEVVYEAPAAPAKASELQDWLDLASQSMSRARSQRDWASRRDFLAKKGAPGELLNLIPGEFSPEAAQDVQALGQERRAAQTRIFRGRVFQFNPDSGKFDIDLGPSEGSLNRQQRRELADLRDAQQGKGLTPAQALSALRLIQSEAGAERGGYDPEMREKSLAELQAIVAERHGFDLGELNKTASGKGRTQGKETPTGQPRTAEEYLELIR